MSPRPSSSSNDELENQSFKLALFLMNKQMIYVISFVFSDTCGAIESSMSHFLSSRQTKKKIHHSSKMTPSLDLGPRSA